MSSWASWLLGRGGSSSGAQRDKARETIVELRQHLIMLEKKEDHLKYPPSPSPFLKKPFFKPYFHAASYDAFLRIVRKSRTNSAKPKPTPPPINAQRPPLCARKSCMNKSLTV